MSISIDDLAKKLNIAPEAVVLHSMDLDFEIGEDDQIPDDIAREIEQIETGDVIAQLEHEVEGQLDKEIIESQQKSTAGQQKKVSHKKKEKKEVAKKEEPKETVIEKDEDGTIILPENIGVRELSLKIGKLFPFVLAKLKQNGIVASIKTDIDYETAAIISEELGVKVRKEDAELTGADLFHGNLSELLVDEDASLLEKRAPVVSIIGHIDHGKTSLLDYIRTAKVADGEAGGITQRIGAYQTEIKGESITFLDTPGHEAFTTMRARGARSTDMAILVVAGTEGLKPQSIEAINHAKEAEIPLIVAINKIDLDGVDLEKVKGQLAENGVNPEDWGGDNFCVPISAKTGKGIDDLLEVILTVAEDLKLQANPNRNAIATILESNMSQKDGITATALINTGTLKKGDSFVCYDQSGRVRTMKDYQGNDFKMAPPSTPVQITGFSHIPRAGDLLQIMENDKIARRKASEVASIIHEDDISKRKKPSLAMIKSSIAEGRMDQLKVIVKAGTFGTLEVVKSEVGKVKTEKVMTKVVHAGVGEITESDIMLAKAGGAIIIGFDVAIKNRITKKAKQERVRIIEDAVIYKLSEAILEIIENKDKIENEEIIHGSLEIKAVFASNKIMAVVGGEVITGKAKSIAHLRQYRSVIDKDEEKAEKMLGTCRLETLQQGADSVGEIAEGVECGLKIKHTGLSFEVGDRLEFFSPIKK